VRPYGGSNCCGFVFVFVFASSFLFVSRAACRLLEFDQGACLLGCSLTCDLSFRFAWSVQPRCLISVLVLAPTREHLEGVRNCRWEKIATEGPLGEHEMLW
jgi:hypothetical protein